jgi:uncharacterized protein
LITGASSGIGAAFARRLASTGHGLVLVARRRDRLEELAAEIEEHHGLSASVLAADLTEPGGRQRVVELIEAGPPLAVLVHSAGFGYHSLFAETDPRVSTAMDRLHVEAPTQIVRAALPGMISAGRGRVLLISSLAGFFTSARYTLYSATKAYLNMLAEGLQAEVEGTGVRVQAICPGLTRTEFLDTPEYTEFKYQQVPDMFWMTPEQVVEEALASRDVIFIPGWKNRLFAGVLRAPLVGSAIRRGLAAANRDGLY